MLGTHYRPPHSTSPSSTTDILYNEHNAGRDDDHSNLQRYPLHVLCKQADRFGTLWISYHISVLLLDYCEARFLIILLHQNTKDLLHYSVLWMACFGGREQVREKAIPQKQKLNQAGWSRCAESNEPFQ
jgi:hypothetical protein